MWQVGEVCAIGLQRFLPGNPRSFPVGQPVPGLRPPPSGSLLLTEAEPASGDCGCRGVEGGRWIFKNPEETVKLTLFYVTTNGTEMEAGGTRGPKDPCFLGTSCPQHSLFRYQIANSTAEGRLLTA